MDAAARFCMADLVALLGDRMRLAGAAVVKTLAVAGMASLVWGTAAQADSHVGAETVKTCQGGVLNAATLGAIGWTEFQPADLDDTAIHAYAAILLAQALGNSPNQNQIIAHWTRVSKNAAGIRALRPQKGAELSRRVFVTAAGSFLQITTHPSAFAPLILCDLALATDDHTAQTTSLPFERISFTRRLNDVELATNALAEFDPAQIGALLNFPFKISTVITTFHQALITPEVTK